MKRILMIALALVTVLSLVACGGSKEKAKNETSEPCVLYDTLSLRR